MTIKSNKNKVGDHINFTIKKIIDIPDSGTHYVLQGENSQKYLFKESQYINYNFEVGSKITCYVAKINCSGKVFLEPLHPYFKIGNKYPFKFIKIDFISNILQQNIVTSIIVDNYGNYHKLIHCDLSKNYKINDIMDFEIDKIREGQVFFKIPNNLIPDNSVKLGHSYSFTIINEKEILDEKHIIVSDHFNMLHSLKHKYYNDYNLIIGKEFQGFVIRLNSQNRFIIEPEHPYYKEGEEYTFDLVYNPPNEDNIVKLKDIFENIFEAPIPTEITRNIGVNQLKLTVKNIRKGLPIFL